MADKTLTEITCIGETLNEFMNLDNGQKMYVKGYMRGVLDNKRAASEPEPPKNDKSA